MTTTRKRQVVRELRVDLDAIARAVLMEQHWPEEELLEVYRHIATTASQSGRRWASRDVARWNRFPGLDRELGRHGWRPSDFPKEGGFGLGFTFSSRDYADKLRDVIMRIAWGSTPQASRWRRIFKSRALVVPCKVCRRVAGRQYASVHPLMRHGKKATRLIVSFNREHPTARDLFGFVLMPTEDGWRLEVEYGVRETSRLYSSWRAYADQYGGRRDDGPESLVPVQRQNESTSDFVARCSSYIESVVDW